MQTFGAHRNMEPAIVTVRLADQPVLVLPLAVTRRRGLRIVSFLGDEHGNQNTGLWDRSFYGDFPPDLAQDLISQIGAATKADCLALRNIPRRWYGRPHPLVLGVSPDSPNAVYRSEMKGGFDTIHTARMSKSARKNLARKQRHLQAAGDYQMTVAEGETEIRTALDAFLDQREMRSRETGIPSGFGTPEAIEFLELLTGPKGEPPVSGPMLQVWTLQIAGAIRATYLCTRLQDTLYAYSNSVAHDELLRHSPGIVLIRDIVERICEDPGIQELDLGIGAERYKTDWTDAQRLADTILGRTLRGRVYAAAMSGQTSLKATIRNNKAAWSLIRSLRRRRAASRASY